MKAAIKLWVSSGEPKISLSFFYGHYHKLVHCFTYDEGYVPFATIIACFFARSNQSAIWEVFLYWLCSYFVLPWPCQFASDFEYPFCIFLLLFYQILLTMTNIVEHLLSTQVLLAFVLLSLFFSMLCLFTCLYCRFYLVVFAMPLSVPLIFVVVSVPLLTCVFFIRITILE